MYVLNMHIPGTQTKLQKNFALATKTVYYGGIFAIVANQGLNNIAGLAQKGLQALAWMSSRGNRQQE